MCDTAQMMHGFRRILYINQKIAVRNFPFL